MNLAREANATEECGGKRVGKALGGVVLSQHGPNLGLAWQDEARR